eukprot:TRINITY_DN7216_c0_g1_i18.p1 TRINITY_DN7216_c0_g1~~TRINITY_DN7216_c0_g1_i18.p1  ORF type:complete len:1613 (-),score=317.99 TRINITY_DN7216_c0_g1_i18:229-5067(-)
MKSSLEMFVILLLTLPGFRALASRIDIHVTTDPQSRVGGFHDLYLDFILEDSFPPAGIIQITDLEFLAATNDCTDFFNIRAPFTSSFTCEVKENLVEIKMNVVKDLLQLEMHIEIKEVKYSVELLPHPITVKILSGEGELMMEGVNRESWIPRNLAEIADFDVQTSNQAPCQPFSFTIIGAPLVPVRSLSLIEVHFSSDIDVSNCISSDIDLSQKSSKEIKAKTKSDYTETSPLHITLEGLQNPSVADTITVTLVTFSLNANPVNTGSKQADISTVRPSTISAVGTVELLSGKVVSATGQYELGIPLACEHVEDPMYVIIPPAEIFGVRKIVVFSPPMAVGEINKVPFALENADSALPAEVLKDKEFLATVYRGNIDNKVLVVRTTFSENVAYQPGELREFRVQPATQKAAEIVSYAFTAQNTHPIPEGGKIVLILNPASFFLPNPVARMGGREMVVESCSEDKVELTTFELVPALTEIEITVDQVRNSLFLNTYSGFSAYSCDTKGYKIDEAGSPQSIVIDQRQTSSATCTLSGARNLEEAEYSFTLNPSVYASLHNFTLDIELPPEISAASCTLASDSFTSVTHEDKNTLSLQITTLENPIAFKYRCRNPATTAWMKLVLRLCGEGRGEALQEEVRVHTTEGASFAQGSYLECDRSCPRCDVTCSIVLKRNTNAAFQSLVIVGEKINFNEAKCCYEDKDVVSVCVRVKDESEDKLKLTVSSPVKTSQVRILDVAISNYPEYPDTFPLTIRTYSTADENSEALIENDVAIEVSGTCSYPCVTCSEGWAICDSCSESEYYLYPDGTEDCATASDTNCRELEDGKCCEGYYMSDSEQKCFKCASSCAKCEGSAESCTECASTHFEYKGECIATCPKGMFVDSSSGIKDCKDCIENCEECENDSECLVCYGDFKLDVENKQCVEICSEGKYQTGNECRICDESCVTCEESATKCTKCHPDRPANYLWATDGTCVTREYCKSQISYVDDTSFICIPCSDGCKDCFLDPYVCRECKDDMYLFIEEGICVNNCSAYLQGYNKKGKDGVGGICAPCENNCLTCESATDCYSCVENKVFLTSAKKCIDSCPEGYYVSNGECHYCPKSCKTCLGKENCISCVEGLYFYSNACYEEGCPVGSFESGEKVCEACNVSCYSCVGNKYNCTKCSSGYIWYEEECLNKCPNTTINVGHGCEYCDPPCFTCKDFKNYCTSCLPGYKLFDGECLARRPKGFAADFDDFVCVKVVLETGKVVDWYLFPHLFATALLSLVAGIGRAINAKSLVLPNIIVVLDYIALFASLGVVFTVPPKFKVLANLFAVLLIVLKVSINIVFLMAYKKFVKIDLILRLRPAPQRCSKYFILIFGTVFSFQTYRLLYSRFMGFNILFARIKNLRLFFKLLKGSSLVQISILQCPTALLSLLGLFYFSNGTLCYFLAIESLALSVLLAFFLILITGAGNEAAVSLKCKFRRIVPNTRVMPDRNKTNPRMPNRGRRMRDRTHDTEILGNIPEGSEADSIGSLVVEPSEFSIETNSSSSSVGDTSDDPMTFGESPAPSRIREEHGRLFRRLIAQSETLIERTRALRTRVAQPHGARGYLRPNNEEAKRVRGKKKKFSMNRLGR